MSDHERIGEILVRLKIISPGDVERVLEALRRRNRRTKFGQTAKDMGLITEEQILAALAVQMELLPGIGKLSLDQILRALAKAELPA